MKKIFLSTLLLFAMATAMMAQQPVPAPDQTKKIALTGGIAHLGNGQVLQNSVIAFDKGKLVIVADASTRPDLTGYDEVKITGKHVYPGFILPNSQVGLMEISSIRAMSDNQEHGDINPNVRALPGYNTDTEFQATFRFNGVLLAEATPTGGIISGTSSVMEMEGWNWEDAAHSVDIAVHMNWPPRMKREFDFATFSFSENPNKDYDKTVQQLDEFFASSKAYANQSSKARNLKLEAMQGVFSGKKTLVLHADNAKEIVEGVRFAQRQGVPRITVVTTTGAYLAAEFLKDNKIPVILTAVHDLPERPDDDVDMPYKQPYLLTQAGVTVSLSHEGMLGGARNLPYYAGTAVAYGMNPEEAIKAITLNPAKALGIEARVGSLEVGKDATLFVSEGDMLEIRVSKVSVAFIRGKLVTLPNKQEELYERFSRKYGHIK